MAAALIIPESRAFFDQVVCGLPLLARAVCALGRGADTVYIVKTPAVPATFPVDLEAVLKIRHAPPQVVWVVDAATLPKSESLFVVATPGVFDYRLCRILSALPQASERVLRCRRSASDDAVLWFIGQRHSAAFVDALVNEGSAIAWLQQQPAVDVDPGKRLSMRVDDAQGVRAAEKQLFAETRKPTDTPIARHFDRYVSNWMTRRLLPLNVTPTQVTLVAFGLGIVGAGLIAVGSYAAGVVGSFLLVASIIVDGCDGEVARLKFLETPNGGRLDFILDNVVNSLTLFTIGFGHYRITGAPFFLYAPLINAAAALASAFPVYFLYYQQQSEAPADTGPKSLSTRIIEGLTGRDFMYMIFVLSLFDRIYWFVYLTLGGIGFFLASVLFLFITRRLGFKPGPRKEPLRQRAAEPVGVRPAVDHASSD